MKKKLNLRDFAILQLVVLIYTSSTVISKIAAQSAESGKGWTFLLLYGAEIGVLGIYALCWQQVIKRVEHWSRSDRILSITRDFRDAPILSLWKSYPRNM